MITALSVTKRPEELTRKELRFFRRYGHLSTAELERLKETWDAGWQQGYQKAYQALSEPVRKQSA